MDDFIFVLEPDFEKFLVQYRRQQEGKKVLYSSFDNDKILFQKDLGAHVLDANNALIDPALRDSNFKFIEEYADLDNFAELGIKYLGLFQLHDDANGEIYHDYLIPASNLKSFMEEI